MNQNRRYKGNKIFPYLPPVHSLLDEHSRDLDEEVSRGMNADLHVSVGEHTIDLISLKKDTKGSHYHYDRDRILQLILTKYSYKTTTCLGF